MKKEKEQEDTIRKERIAADRIIMTYNAYHTIAGGMLAILAYAIINQIPIAIGAALLGTGITTMIILGSKATIEKTFWTGMRQRAMEHAEEQHGEELYK